MTTDATELTAQQVWDEEASVRESGTAKAAAEANTDISTPTHAEATVVEDQTNQNGDDQTETGKAEAAGNESEQKPDVMQQILEKIDKIEARQRNVEGHIGGLKASQQAMHAAMEAARKQTVAEGDAPSKVQVAAASANPEKWEELKKDFPEWAEATEELLGSRLQNLQQGKGSIDPDQLDALVSERVTKIIEPMKREIEINAHLEGVMPGWRDEVKSNKFGEWLESQPKDVQALAASSDVKDAATMLRLYSAHQKADPSGQIQQDRQQKLAQATALPKGKAAPKAKTIDQMTPEELWDHEAELRERERAKRGY